MKRKAATIILAFALSGCASPLAWTQPSQAPTRLPAAVNPNTAAAAAAGNTGTGSASVNTSSGPLLGAYEADAPSSWSGLSEFASVTGVTPQIALYYSAWNSGFNTAFAQTARSHGAYVFAQIQPNGVTLASIAAGGSDDYLRQYARTVRAFGHPVILSFAHEMNGNWYTWGAGHTSPSDFVAAWRHVVQIFRDEGASNVTWVWTVNSTNIGPHDPLSQWWPGSSWVNWVGIDGYYYFSSDSFDSVFGQTIAQIRTFTNAPVMISETAVGGTSDRESQIAALFSGIRADHIVGAVWFDKAQHNGVYHQDWRLEDDSAALAAFRAAVRKYPRSSDG
jgi:mannan endo-1,4-beta-mannosidase